MNSIAEPLYLEKGFAEDHRGSLEFYNDLKLDEFRRFYIVNNPKAGTVRAWHGHKIEAKLVKVLRGEFVVCTVKVDNWESPNKEIQPTRFTLDQDSGIVYIPPGYANGAINLLDESSIMYFSSLTLEDSKNDDYRFDAQYWNPWIDFSPEIYE
tara:strand:+ start:14748 stop:15206 length:459 start_codon:yes stop_codon:yes gene_type:complete